MNRETKEEKKMHNQITAEETVSILFWLGWHQKLTGWLDSKRNFYESDETAYLYSPEGQIELMKKIWTVAALHTEEIPKPEAVIMPFCDVAGRDDFYGNGTTIEDSILLAVLEYLK